MWLMRMRLAMESRRRWSVTEGGTFKGRPTKDPHVSAQSS